MTDRETSSGTNTGRRGFIGRLFTGLGVASLGASLVSSLYANFRFFFPKVLYEPPSQFKAGVPEEYQPGTISDRWVRDYQVWILRDDKRLYALLGICTHLGCLARYFPNEDLFKCPCHGSNFSVQGDPLAGPAPVPLYRLALSVGDDGQIVVDKALRENRPGKRDQPPYVLEV